MIHTQAVEDQAINRVHRLGQTKPVLIKRLVVSGTVETALLALQVCACCQLHTTGVVCLAPCPALSLTLAVSIPPCIQEKKRAMANSALSSTATQSDRMSFEDLLLLFR